MGHRPSSGRAGMATLLFTDVEGSTRLLRSDPAAYPGRLERHRTTLRRAFAAGVEVDAVGGALFCVFGCGRDAIQAAAAGQRALAADRQLSEAGLRVRMGLSTGVVERLGDGYVGVELHRAARVMAAAHGGQVLVGSTTASL